MHFDVLRWLLLHGHHARHVLHLRGTHFGRHHHMLRHGTRWVQHRWAGKRVGR